MSPCAPDIDWQLIIEFKRAKFPKAISPPISWRNFVTSWTSHLANKIGRRTRSPTAQRRGKTRRVSLHAHCTWTTRNFQMNWTCKNYQGVHSPVSTGVWVNLKHKTTIKLFFAPKEKEKQFSDFVGSNKFHSQDQHEKRQTSVTHVKQSARSVYFRNLPGKSAGCKFYPHQQKRACFVKKNSAGNADVGAKISELPVSKDLQHVAAACKSEFKLHVIKEIVVYARQKKCQSKCKLQTVFTAAFWQI